MLSLTRAVELGVEHVNLVLICEEIYRGENNLDFCHRVFEQNFAQKFTVRKS